MAIDRIELRNHVATNPNNVGGLSWRLQPNRILKLLNQPNYGDIAAGMQRGDFSRAIASVVLDLDTASAPLQKKWDRILTWVYAQDELTESDIARVLGAMEADGLVSKEDRGSIGKRKGTYAETVWGAGTVITIAEVIEARP